MDSTQDTLDHIRRVQSRLLDFSAALMERAIRHDASKLMPPEKECFDEVTHRLRGMTYGSDEYKAALKDLNPALDHHYRLNSHHPEHYPNGIDGMSLLDVVEMLCDWKSASERHDDGDIFRSIQINRERFHMSDQLALILDNTAKHFYAK